MSVLISSFSDTIKKIVGKFDTSQMIAVGVVLLIAVLLGFLIGAIALYRSGVKKGKKVGMREVVTLAMEKAEEKLADRVEEALTEEKQRREEMLAEKDQEIQELQARLQEAEQAKATAEQELSEAQKTKEQAEQAALAAEKTKEEAAQAALEAQKSKEEAERARLESEEKLRSAQEIEAATPKKEAKKELTLLSKQEILDFAGSLDEYLPASIYERGGADLPDSCRVGICTFLLVYERKGMVKLVLRLHKKAANALEKRFKLFTPAVYPKGEDWYKWILSSEVTDLSVVTAAIRMAYEYAFVSNYDEETKEINVEFANRYEMLINEAILKYKDLPDRDFAVASDAAERGNAAYRLYGKGEMTEFALSLQGSYPVTVSVGSGDLSPNTFKVGGKTFLMAYEKDGVAKMIFRLSEEKFDLLKQKHPTAEISSFPKAKGYHWYVVYIDETFSTNADIEEIIKDSCAHVNDLS